MQLKKEPKTINIKDPKLHNLSSINLNHMCLYLTRRENLKLNNDNKDEKRAIYQPDQI